MFLHWTKIVGSALLLSLVTFGSAFAAYPERPITLIVPFGAGGVTDIPARLLAHMLETKLGQPVIVQNISGAGGTQGTAQVAAAKPDGYTFGYVAAGTMSLQPHVLNLPFGKDSFDFMGLVTRQPLVLVSPKKAPWKNLEEMVEIVKAAPNKYIVGITATGNMTHLPILVLAKHYGLQLRFIPYRSTTEIMKDMAANRTHFYADSPVSLSQFDVFGLLQFSNEKAENLSMPTVQDIGLDNTFVHWQGVVAPKGIPAAEFETFSKALQEAVTSEHFKNETRKMGTNAYWLDSKDFSQMYFKEFEFYGRLIKETMAK